MNAKSTNTKELLLDAAQELIQRRGLNAMSFQDLSDAVGIRKASVHHHFANKSEMVNALVLRFLGDFDEEVSGILKSRCSGKTKLKRYCGLFGDMLQNGEQDRNCLCGMLMAEMLSLDETGLDLVRRFLKTNIRYVREIAAEGVRDGSLNDQGNVTGTAELVLSAVEGGLLLARCEGGPRRFTQVMSRLITLLSAE